MSTIPSVLAPTISSFTPEVQSPAFSGLVQELVNVITLGTAATTITAAQMLGGLILQPAGTAINTTLDTAAHVFLAMQSVQVGSSFSFTIRNTSTAAATITVVAGTGGTFSTSNTATVTQNNQRSFRLIITALGDVNGVGATYTLYTGGTGAF